MTSSRPGTPPIRCTECQQPMDSPIGCATCGALGQLPPGNVDCFTLFGLPHRFEVDLKALHTRLLTLSRVVHPDVAGVATPEKREQALRLSSELNRAYETLRDPLARAEYLLHLAGGPSASDDKSVPPELLGEVMTLREEIEEATTGGNGQALRSLKTDLAARRESGMAQLAALVEGIETPGEAGEQGRKRLRVALNVIKYWNNLLERIPAAPPI